MIFKKAQNIIRGRFSVPPDENYDPQFASKFFDEYHRGYGQKPFEKDEKRSYNLSLIIHSDGSVDLLPDHHDDFLWDIYENMPGNRGSYRDLGDTSSRVIHNVLGGIRAFLSKSYKDSMYLALTLFQIPNENQLKKIDDIVASYSVSEMSCHVYLNMNGKNYSRFLEGSWGKIKNDLLNIQAEGRINEEALRRVDVINQFRDPEVDFTKPKFKPTPVIKPNPNKFNVSDVIDSIKDTPIKTPSSLKYKGGFSVMDFIKKADELLPDFDENKYKSTGDFQREKPIDFNHEYADEFRKFYHNHPLNEKIDNRNFENIIYDSSLIIYNDGTIDQLSDHHRDHLREISNEMASRTGKEDVFYNYPDTLGYNGTYEAIHHVLGGCRGYLVKYFSNEYVLMLAIYQFPTYEQMKTIDNLNSKYKFQRVEVDLYYSYDGSNHYVNKNGPWDVVKAKILQLKAKLKSGLSHSDSNLHNLIKKFKSNDDQFYNPLDQSRPAERSRRNQFNLKDVVEKIQNLPIKTPSSLRYTGGFSVMDLIRLGKNDQSPKPE